jgi:pyridoxine 4-dehydrogenase
MTIDKPTPGGLATLGDRDVARIGYGAMQLERLAADPDAAIALVRAAVARGIDHIDTAQFYGDGFANDVLRRAIDGDDHVVVVTKVGADPAPGNPVPLRPAQRPEQLRASVEDNLRSLGTDRLDVVNLRLLYRRPGLVAEGDQLVPLDDQLAEMTALRDEGKLGAIGLSAVTAESVVAAEAAGIVCVQNAYSLVAREDEELLDHCAAHGIAWVPFFPLGSAFPRFPKVVDDPTAQRIAAELGVPTARVGLAWLLAHRPNILLVPGTADLGHLDDNLAAGEIVLTPRMMAELDEVAANTAPPAPEAFGTRNE